METGLFASDVLLTRGRRSTYSKPKKEYFESNSGISRRCETQLKINRSLFSFQLIERNVALHNFFDAKWHRERVSEDRATKACVHADHN
jgi:hypothetical protein